MITAIAEVWGRLLFRFRTNNNSYWWMIVLVGVTCLCGWLWSVATTPENYGIVDAPAAVRKGMRAFRPSFDGELAAIASVLWWRCFWSRGMVTCFAIALVTYPFFFSDDWARFWRSWGRSIRESRDRRATEGRETAGGGALRARPGGLVSFVFHLVRQAYVLSRETLGAALADILTHR